MPRYICKFEDKNKSYYLEWSTIVDAPISYGMSLDDFKKYYEERYGSGGMFELAARLERVEKSGTSARNQTLDDVIGFNRAGPKESHLTKKQIIKEYCRGKQ